MIEMEQPLDEEFVDLSELFKVFGDSTRLKILFALFEKELCVLDIADKIGMTQSAISHQLKVLKVNKLISSKKVGKQVFYSLLDEHVHKIVAMGLEHLREE